MRTVRYSIIKHVLLFLAILLLSACATTKIKIVDDSTGESIADAFVYIRPMHLLPFPIGKLNILILSDKNGNVFTTDSSFYLYAGKHGYGLTNSYDYDSNKDLYIVRLKRESNIKMILFNGSKYDFDSLKMIQHGRAFWITAGRTIL